MKDKKSIQSILKKNTQALLFVCFFVIVSYC